MKPKAENVKPKPKSKKLNYINIYPRENGYSMCIQFWENEREAIEGEDKEYVAHNITEVGAILSSLGIK